MCIHILKPAFFLANRTVPPSPRRDRRLKCHYIFDLNFFFQGVGMMKGRINLDYEHSPDPYDRHRALFMHWPTTEMTGDYTCKVSTLQNDVTGTKRMTVFGMYI